ncbi:hypothetical protein ACX6XY_07325 [Streptomyces sp. O3]
MSEATTRTLRTLLQTAVGLAVVLPSAVEASGLPATLPWVAGALTAAGALTRVMALPGVQALLPRWLRLPTDVPPAQRRTPTDPAGREGGGA